MSPLVDLDIASVSQSALDYMHLICLGVTRRILHYFRKGPPCCRLSKLQISRISKVLVSFRQNIPSNFSRKPRSLFEMDR